MAGTDGEVSEEAKAWPRHARTEVIPAVDNAVWGPDRQGRRWFGPWLDRARRGPVLVVVLVAACVTALSLFAVFHRPPPRAGSAGDWRADVPVPVAPPGTDDPTSAPASASASASGSASASASASRRPSPTPTPTPTSTPTRPASPSAGRTSSPTPSPLGPTSYEAESASNQLRSGARVDRLTGASGGWAVYALGAPNGGTLRFTGVTAPTAGTYTVTVYYQNPDSRSRTAQITVNSNAPLSVSFGSTGSCCIGARTVTVTLTAGANSIQFGNPSARAPDIDRIVVTRLTF